MTNKEEIRQIIINYWKAVDSQWWQLEDEIDTAVEEIMNIFNSLI
jgi:hypothetical protein